VVVLRKALAPPLRGAAGFDAREYLAYDAEVEAVHRELGRGFSEERARRRFQRGLRFYAVRQAGATVATTWMVVEGERFVDEIGAGFPLPTGDVWIRDAFVAPRHRGRRVFSAALDCVLSRGFPAASAVWSDVGRQNTASLRAHAAYGFAPVGRFTVLQLAGTVAVRLRWPAGRLRFAAHEAGRRVLLTGASYRRFIREHLA
jgi:RimJ/RimL family protein N-acetyltransferase